MQSLIGITLLTNTVSSHLLLGRLFNLVQAKRFDSKVQRKETIEGEELQPCSLLANGVKVSE